MIYAYARVSTRGQNPEGQLDKLKEHGYDQLYAEKASGARAKRPQLEEIRNKIQPGDTLLIYRLDRLGRSLRDLVNLIEELTTRNVILKSLSENIDTSSASGKLIVHIFASMADFERNLISERTNIGLSAARARGRQGGRPKGIPAASHSKAKVALKLYREKQMRVADICKTLGYKSPNTFYRHIEWAKEQEPENQQTLNLTK